MEKGSFQKSPFSRDSRDFRDSSVFREPAGCGKQRRFRPFSRDSREFRDFRDSRDFSSEKTPFVMTPFSIPEQGEQVQLSKNWKRGRQTGVRQSSPPIVTRYGNTVSTPYASKTNGTNRPQLTHHGRESKRKADTEIQHRPRIADTDIDCGPRFCGPRFRDPQFIKTARGMGATKWGFVQLKGACLLLQGPWFPLRGPPFPLQGPSQLSNSRVIVPGF